MSTPVTYRFSFGPWNISEGGDPFGGDVRKVFPHEEKFALYRPLGFNAPASRLKKSCRGAKSKCLSVAQVERYEL